MIKTIVVDDEAAPRNAIKEMLTESKHFEFISEASDVTTAVREITELNPELVFLDILLRGGTAFDVLELLKSKKATIPYLVVNSALSNYEYATKFLNEYRENVILILKKPFWEHWDEKEEEILNRMERERSKTTLKTKDGSLILKSEHNSYLIKMEDLIYCEISQEKSQGKLVLYSKNREYEVYKTLANMMKDLPSEFMRVSRFTAINVNFLSHYDHSDQVLFLHGVDKGIGVGNKYKDQLLEFLS